MSVQVNTYVLFGVMLPCGVLEYDDIEEYLDGAFKPDTNPKGNVTVLYDGMGGKYTAVGHVVAKTGNHAAFEEPIAIGDAPHEWVIDIRVAFAEMGVCPPPVSCGWHVISHYR